MWSITERFWVQVLTKGRYTNLRTFYLFANLLTPAYVIPNSSLPGHFGGHPATVTSSKNETEDRWQSVFCCCTPCLEYWLMTDLKRARSTASFKRNPMSFSSVLHRLISLMKSTDLMTGMRRRYCRGRPITINLPTIDPHSFHRTAFTDTELLNGFLFSFYINVRAVD